MRHKMWKEKKKMFLKTNCPKTVCTISGKLKLDLRRSWISLVAVWATRDISKTSLEGRTAFCHFLQVFGENKSKMGNNSSLPASISNINTVEIVIVSIVVSFLTGEVSFQHFIKNDICYILFVDILYQIKEVSFQ